MRTTTAPTVTAAEAADRLALYGRATPDGLAAGVVLYLTAAGCADVYWTTADGWEHHAGGWPAGEAALLAVEAHRLGLDVWEAEDVIEARRGALDFDLACASALADLLAPAQLVLL